MMRPSTSPTNSLNTRANQVDDSVDEINPDIELLTRVASMYYLDDATQQEIALALGLSRPKVGRLLKKAKEEGIVEITVRTHPALSMQLERALTERFGLRQAMLVSDQRDPDAQRAQVARMVANFLVRNLRDGHAVAVGMGRNVGAVPDHVIDAAPRKCTFISAMGGSPHVGQPINPNDICRRLAERFGGYAEVLYAPAYADSRAMRDSIMGHDDVRQSLDHARRADFALVGIGDARDDSAVVQMGCFTAREMRQMRHSGAVGDILGCFFNLDGTPVADNMLNRTVGLSPDDLRKIPCVIAVASETGKSMAILGALRSGIVNVLATSIGNARSVLELADGVRP
ncbi:MAG: DNA-binding protein [Candidatus Roseilinea sp.]|nr:MAG: DNA-binding protein [Candidatus Roseilinea sp.]